MGEKILGYDAFIVMTPQLLILRVCSISAEARALMLVL